MKLSDFKDSKPKNEQVSESNLQQIYDKYKNSSQSELFSALMQEVASQKANGTFNFENLQKMVNSLEGAVPQENFEQMKRILNRLK